MQCFKVLFSRKPAPNLGALCEKRRVAGRCRLDVVSAYPKGIGTIKETPLALVKDASRKKRCYVQTGKIKVAGPRQVVANHWQLRIKVNKELRGTK